MQSLMRSFACCLALTGVATVASAAAPALRRHGNPSSAAASPSAPEVVGGTSITQSTNASTVTTGASVSCNGGAPGFFHTDNSYYRAFTLSAFNPPLDQLQFMVQAVTIGIETANASGVGTTQPVTINIFNSSANPPTLATLGPVLSTQTVNVSDQSNSTLLIPLVTQPVFTVGTGILVVEVFTTNGQAAGHSFFMGANALGQSGPSFIRAAPCGLTDIGNLTGIGFPNMHVVMTVHGNSQAPVELLDLSVD